MLEKLGNMSSESPFDRIKHTATKGYDYWRARELFSALGYSEWENAEKVISKAQTSCVESREALTDHFRETTEMVGIGSGAKREVRDLYLTRYACYLIAMNGDPSKRVIAEAQSYFAIQTKRQEETDKLTDEQKRIILRDRVKNGNTILNEAAHECGVEDFARFQSAGYRGLYGGFGVADLKKKKGIPVKHDLLDCISREELAANEFRITQTEKRLRTENIDGEDHATDLHHEVGKKVRKAIQEIGGTMPENLAAEPNIARITKKPENRILAESLKEPRKPANTLNRPAVSPHTNPKWKPDTRVIVCGVSNGTLTDDGTGFQNFANLDAAREVFPDLDTHRNGERFTQAMGNPAKDAMRFETWKAYDLYSVE